MSGIQSLDCPWSSPTKQLYMTLQLKTCILISVQGFPTYGMLGEYVIKRSQKVNLTMAMFYNLWGVPNFEHILLKY